VIEVEKWKNQLYSIDSTALAWWGLGVLFWGLISSLLAVLF
jgi:hypothetical protein